MLNKGKHLDISIKMWGSIVSFIFVKFVFIYYFAINYHLGHLIKDYQVAPSIIQMHYFSTLFYINCMFTILFYMSFVWYFWDLMLLSRATHIKKNRLINYIFSRRSRKLLYCVIFLFLCIPILIFALVYAENKMLENLIAVILITLFICLLVWELFYWKTLKKLRIVVYQESFTYKRSKWLASRYFISINLWVFVSGTVILITKYMHQIDHGDYSDNMYFFMTIIMLFIVTCFTWFKILSKIIALAVLAILLILSDIGYFTFKYTAEGILYKSNYKSYIIVDSSCYHKHKVLFDRGEFNNFLDDDKELVYTNKFTKYFFDKTLIVSEEKDKNQYLSVYSINLSDCAFVKLEGCIESINIDKVCGNILIR